MHNVIPGLVWSVLAATTIFSAARLRRIWPRWRVIGLAAAHFLMATAFAVWILTTPRGPALNFWTLAAASAMALIAGGTLLSRGPLAGEDLLGHKRADPANR
jgi:hypothetical protein